MQSSAATIEIAQPKLFSMGAVMAVSAYGLLLAAPTFASMVVVSVMTFSPLTPLIPLFVMIATAYFFPFGDGNTHVTRLVLSLNPAGQNADGFVVQLTLAPRIRSGLRALLEDADDIGYLSFTETGLQFQGDSVKLSVPFSRIERVQSLNIGLRGLFAYWGRVRVVVSGLPQVNSLEFAERSAWVVPTSRAITRRLCERLTARGAMRIEPGTAQSASP